MTSKTRKSKPVSNSHIQYKNISENTKSNNIRFNESTQSSKITNYVDTVRGRPMTSSTSRNNDQRLRHYRTGTVKRNQLACMRSESQRFKPEDRK